MTTISNSNALAHLWEMGEWMAYGFYETTDLPWPRPYGRVSQESVIARTEHGL